MKSMLNLVFLTLMTLAVLGCAKSGQNSGLQVYDGKWGHLPTLRNTNPSSIFLIHQNKDDNYDICVPEYMIQKYPGIQVEIEASINLWAHYIGRNISVEFNVQALPEMDDADVTSLDQIKMYYSLCGDSTDLVIGEAFSDGSTLGFTQQTYSYFTDNVTGKHDVASFKRGLFLRKHKPSDAKEYNWVSFESKTEKKHTKEELLDLLIKRETIGFRKTDNTYTTLPIIIHEIGHIWGLCDQYVIGEDGTNCDSEFASIDEEGHVVLDFDAQMSSAGWKEKYYLGNDDITGVRKLAERFHNSHWPSKEEFEKTPINPIKREDIELFKINSAKYDNDENKFIVDFAMSTNKPIEFRVSLKPKGSRGMVNYFPMTVNQPAEYNHYYLNLSIGKSEIEKVLVKYKVVGKEESITLEHTPEVPKVTPDIEVPQADEVSETISSDETACENEVCSS